MTRLTLTIEDKANAKLLARMLKSLEFVKSIEAEEYPLLSNEEIQVLEERMEEYRKNPNSVKSAKRVHSELKKKYGF